MTRIVSVGCEPKQCALSKGVHPLFLFPAGWQEALMGPDTVNPKKEAMY